MSVVDKASDHTCHVCSKVFSTKYNLSSHVSSVHMGIKRKRKAAARIKCEICHKSLSSKRSYQDHLNSHTDQRPYQCTQCDYAAKHSMNLLRHIQRNHVLDDEKPYACPYCASVRSSFVNPDDYKRHLKKQHPGLSGTFACTICSFITFAMSAFEGHMSKHDEELERLNLNEETFSFDGSLISEDRGGFLAFLVDDALGRKPELLKKQRIFKKPCRKTRIDDGTSSLGAKEVLFDSVWKNLPAAEVAAIRGARSSCPSAVGRISIRRPSEEVTRSKPRLTAREEDLVIGTEDIKEAFKALVEPPLETLEMQGLEEPELD